MYLGKNLLTLPIRGQYEQLCNAAALAKRNIPVLHKMDSTFHQHVSNWLAAPNPQPLTLTHSTDQLIRLVIEKGISQACETFNPSMAAFAAEF